MERRNGKRMLAAACRYAYSRFVLNDYMFYEMLSESSAPSQRQAGFRDTFLNLTGRFLQGEYPLQELDVLRRQMIEEMALITSYVDCFQIYEHVLNRMEGRFSEETHPLIDDEAVVDEIMRYIVSAKESAEQNERIKSVLEQLPVRFTKAKFFSLVSQALSIYEGTDKKSLEDVLYMIRTEAMLELPEDMETGHEELYRILEKLRNGSYKNMTAESFQELQSSLTLAEEMLSNASSDCMIMMDLVNDFYVICLTRPDTLMDNQEEALFHSIISNVWEKLSQKDYSMPEEEMDDLLIQMEGRQERYYEQWSAYEMADLESVPAEEKTSEEYQKLWKIGRLLSTSSFMTLDQEEIPEEEDILLSRRAVEELCEPLFADLEAAWKGMPRCVVRAVMAKLLAVLPMFFTSSDEIRQFVSGALAACTDLPEKNASVDLIRMIMENEDALV